MHLLPFIPLLSLLTLTAAKPHAFVTRRTVSTNTTIYAYGTNISGVPLVYGLSDGLAYISSTSPLPSTLAAITWDISTDTSTTWNATTANQTSVGSFFISPSDSFAAAGFAGSNTSMSFEIFAFPCYYSWSKLTGTATAVTTTGFSLFGEQVVFVNGSTYESQFWAGSTDTDGVWGLYWNQEGSVVNGSVPVVLKTIAPSGTTST